VQRPLAQPYLQRVTNGKVVIVESRWRQRMGDVLHLVAVANPDEAREVVLHDPEMVTVIIDVGRQNQRIAASLDQLFAERRRLPVDIRRDLIGADYLRRIGKA